MSRFTAYTWQAGDHWIVQVPEIRHGVTQCVHSTQAHDTACWFISMMLNIPAQSFEVDVHVGAPALSAS